MKKIILTAKQQEELLKITLESFKESGIRQSIKDEHKWWAKNILNGIQPYRVDRIESLHFNVYLNQA